MQKSHLLLLPLVLLASASCIQSARSQSVPPKDLPSQRWLPLPEVKRDSVGTQTELLRMLGQLMDSSVPKELGRMSPEQLAEAQKAFQEWREKSGADIPGLESIPPEWIEQVTADPTMQKQARRLLEQFSENRTLPDQSPNGSIPNVGPKEPIHELMERFNKKEERSGNSSQTNPRPDRSSANPNPPRAEGAGSDGRQGPQSPRGQLPRGQSSQRQLSQERSQPESAPPFDARNRQSQTRQSETTNPSTFRDSQSRTSPQQDRQLPFEENGPPPSEPSNFQQRGSERSRLRGINNGQQSSPSPEPRGSLTPESRPSDSRANPSDSRANTPSSERGNANPFRNLNATDRDSQLSEPNNFGPRSDPFGNESPSEIAAPFDASNSTENSSNRTNQSKASENTSTEPPDLTPALRRQLAQLLEQLAKRDALPRIDSRFDQDPSSNSASNSAKTTPKARKLPDAAKSRRGLTQNRNSRSSTQSRRPTGEPPSPTSPDFDPARNDTTRNRTAGNGFPGSSGLVDDSAFSNGNLGAAPSGSAPRNPNSSASENPGELTDEQKRMIDAFAEDKNYLDNWKQNNQGRKPSTRSSGSERSSITPQQLMDLAQKAAGDSKIADQVVETLSKSAGKAPTNRSSGKRSSGNRSSNLDIESQVERFGFGQTLQNIVKKTIDAEETKKSAPSNAANVSNSQGGLSGQSGTSKSAQSKANSLPSDQALARNENRPSGSQQNSNSKSKAGSESNKTSTLEQIADSFWEASKPAASSATSSSSSSQSSSPPTGGVSFSAPQFSMGRDTWIAIGIVVALIAAWFFLKQRGIAQAEILKREVRWAKQAIKSGLNSRADLVRAYHTLVLNRTSPASKWWTHRYVQVQLAQRIPQLKETLSELTELYEVARYAPPQEEFRAEQLDSAKAALAQLESAAA